MAHPGKLTGLLIAALALVTGAWFLSNSRPAAAAGNRMEPVSSATETSPEDHAPVTEVATPVASRSEASPNTAAEEATVPPGEEPTEELVGSTLSGLIVDEQGFTVAGAEVRVWPGRRV